MHFKSVFYMALISVLNYLYDEFVELSSAEMTKSHFSRILESILLDNPHKAAVLSVGCASFSSTLFPSTQLSVNMLGYSTL